MTDFHGPDYDQGMDKERLTRAMDKVRDFWLMGWATLDECTKYTGVPQASASSLLRQLTREENGGFLKEKRRRGEPGAGLFEYRILPPVKISTEKGGQMSFA